ncbi:hypothetical protein COY23_02385 [bacterium (Candidatus Torokbacteria) CG_4_10_14_0_2_um_filter_35_8]|nr:MAG: hypothetical protein COY23_02385 [bacterium (Candidatus Torokbacteria) CG_4_10_14_0_2_um_filter_35_8]
MAKDYIKTCKICKETFILSKAEQSFFKKLPTKTNTDLCHKCRLKEKLRDKPRK